MSDMLDERRVKAQEKAAADRVRREVSPELCAACRLIRHPSPGAPTHPPPLSGRADRCGELGFRRGGRWVRDSR